MKLKNRVREGIIPSLIVFLLSSPAQATHFHLISAATTNCSLLPGGPNGTGSAPSNTIFAMWLGNSNAAIRYVKLYDTNVTPVPGTTSVKYTLIVPASTGHNPPQSVVMSFSKGIGICTLVNMADSDTTAVGLNDISIDIDYQ